MRLLLLFLSCTPLLPQNLANPAKLADAQISRGSTLKIDIDGGPAAAKPLQVTLIGQGVAVAIGDAKYDPPAAGKAAGAVTGTVPDDIAFGTYQVKVDVAGYTYKVDRLTIGPPGNSPVHLNEFSPPYTYETETAYFPDRGHAAAASVDLDDYELQVDRSRMSEIVIEWKGGTYHPVLNGCNPLPPLGTQANPVESPSHFFAKAGDGSVTLCRVPTDARFTVAGTAAVPQPAGKHAQMWILRPTRGVATSTVRLTLRGSGFQVARPSDNTIFINGERSDVAWDTCSDVPVLGESANPRPRQIHGEVIGPDEIHLCLVPVPENGQLRLQTAVGDVRSEARVFRVFSMGRAEVASIAAFFALILALLPLFLLSFVQESYRIGGKLYKLRMLFLDPQTDTYSLSKLQFYMWTNAAIFSYLYLFISRVAVQFVSWPDVPATLPAIIFVSAGTAVGSQLVTAAKGSKGGGEEKPSFADFITSGGVVAADRLQMFVWTILGVGAFFFAVLQLEPGNITDLPTVPERLLVLMGISSAGYLGGKMARKAGPVIDEISVTPSNSDSAIAKQSAAAAGGMPDLVQALIDGQAGLSKLKPASNTNAKAAIDALAKAVKAAGAAHTVSEFNQLVTQLVALRGAAESSAAAAASDFDANKATADEAQDAQEAAAFLQDFSAAVTQAVSLAAVDAMRAETTPALISRTIELRGSNLSPDALLEIDHIDLPFKMLFNKDGQNAPDILVRDQTTPTFARILRLVIDPARFDAAYLEQFRQWFAVDGPHTFIFTNPDGQKAELGFDLPPGAAHKVGSST